MYLKFPLRENLDLVLVNIFYLWNKLQTKKNRDGYMVWVGGSYIFVCVGFEVLYSTILNLLGHQIIKIFNVHET